MDEGAGAMLAPNLIDLRVPFNFIQDRDDLSFARPGLLHLFFSFELF
jgi:hypothetical protein